MGIGILALKHWGMRTVESDTSLGYTASSRSAEVTQRDLVPSIYMQVLADTHSNTNNRKKRTILPTGKLLLKL